MQYYRWSPRPDKLENPWRDAELISAASFENSLATSPCNERPAPVSRAPVTYAPRAHRPLSAPSSARIDEGCEKMESEPQWPESGCKLFGDPPLRCSIMRPASHRMHTLPSSLSGQHSPGRGRGPHHCRRHHHRQDEPDRDAARQTSSSTPRPLGASAHTMPERRGGPSARGVERASLPCFSRARCARTIALSRGDRSAASRPPFSTPRGHNELARVQSVPPGRPPRAPSASDRVLATMLPLQARRSRTAARARLRMRPWPWSWKEARHTGVARGLRSWQRACVAFVYLMCA